MQDDCCLLGNQKSKEPLAQLKALRTTAPRISGRAHWSNSSYGQRNFSFLSGCILHLLGQPLRKQDALVYCMAYVCVCACAHVVAGVGFPWSWD